MLRLTRGRERAHPGLGKESSRRRARGRYALAAAAAGAGAVVLAAAAYPVARELVVGGPAPPEIERAIARAGRPKGELIPIPRRVPGAIAGKTRVAAKLESSVGTIYLFAAPTRWGGFHTVTSTVGGGGAFVARSLTAVSSETLVRGRYVRLLAGYAPAGIRRVEMRVAGRWVGVPLQGRWFLVEPAAEPSEVAGYDARGRRAERQSFAGADATAPPHPVGPRRTVLEIRTRCTRRPIRAEVARASDGGVCETLVTPGGTSAGCRGRAIRRRQIGVSPLQIGAAPKGMLLLFERVGRDIARLELRFEDGRTERLPLARGLSVYQVAREDVRRGRRPSELVGRDRAGRLVATKRLPGS
jgi:hypothetical protein